MSLSEIQAFFDRHEDLEFEYDGVLGSILPFSVDDQIHVKIDTDEWDFSTVDAVMAAPIFDGKSLAEIADDIEY